ncbi:MAG: inositol monophosphatase family protein [Alphaproteobacteria bacterium]|nr:inositol monophosphatase family protein [Alphaproteobacteria bacterium]
MSITTEIQTLTDFALDLAVASARVILPHFRKNIAIDNKLETGWDPVTEADRAAERVIRELIEKKFPDHSIIGEEYGTKTTGSAYSWVLDPIDGTRSFVIGMPTWATLIGLYRDGQPLLGVMNQPFVGEAFYGNPNGAWNRHNGQTTQIHVRPGVPLAKASIGTTAPHFYDDNPGFHKLRKTATALRFGGDAYFFAVLAAGQLDIAMDASLQIYDIAALIPIIRGAGGMVGTWTDNDPTQGGNVLCATTPELLDEARRMMRGEA